jgi:hypothetical protein
MSGRGLIKLSKKGLRIYGDGQKSLQIRVDRTDVGLLSFLFYLRRFSIIFAEVSWRLI